jgi:hypothetical protein
MPPKQREGGPARTQWGAAPVDERLVDHLAAELAYKLVVVDLPVRARLHVPWGYLLRHVTRVCTSSAPTLAFPALSTSYALTPGVLDHLSCRAAQLAAACSAA